MIWFHFITILFLILQVKANQLKFIFTDIFLPCPNQALDYEDFIMGNVEIIPSDKENQPMILNGNITFIKEFDPNFKSKAEFKPQVKKRGVWMDLPYYMASNDFCPVLFDKSSLWASLIDYLTEEQRRCPPKAGVVYPVKNIEFEIPINIKVNLRESDEYRFILKHYLHFMDGPAELCYVNYGYLTRS